MSDIPGGDDPAEPTVRRPRLFGSGARDDASAPGSPVGKTGGDSAAASSASSTAEAAASVPSTGDTAAASVPSTGDTAAARTTDQTGTHRHPGDQASDESGNQANAGSQATAGGPASSRARGVGKAGRSRRLTVVALLAGVAIILVALCAGGIGVVSAIHGARSDAADAREARRLRDADCLELETRLNRLAPPGAAATPAARATAVLDENAAVRLYILRLRDQRDADAWRQLVDARTTYARSLRQESKTRTPAFFVVPRVSDGRDLADQLARWSPAACGGSIRRLVQPDL